MQPVIELPPPFRLIHGRHGWMLANPNDFYMGRSLLTYGECAEHEIRFLMQILGEHGLVVEAGANMGVHTTPMARRLAGQKRRLLAFEPQPFVYRQLCANLALNGLTNVAAWPYACGAEPGKVTFVEPDYLRVGNFGGVAMGEAGAGSGGFEVPSVRIDDLVEKQDVALLKIDVEGAELKVLRGASASIERSRPVIYLENDRPANSAALIEWLWDAGYKLWWHVTELFNAENYFGVSKNDYPGEVSVNMVAIPKETDVEAPDLILVEDSHWHPLGG
jgi:FkbM family methyltransferase